MAQLLSDFLAEEVVSKPNIIGRGILPVGSKCILGGAAKSNKSFTVLNAALDLAKGRPLFDAKYKSGVPVFPVTKSWRVLLFEQEIGEQGLKNRLRAMVPPEEALCDLYIKSKDTNIRFDTDEGLSEIKREIEDHEPDIVIFDPLSKFHLLDENDAAEMGRVMRVADGLIQRYGVTIIFIHHTGLAAFDPENKRRGGAKLRGSSAIFADVDTYIEVVNLSGGQEKEPTLKLSLELRQGEPIRPQRIKRTKSGRIQYIGEE